jgi:selenocysteine lyase/cysteine desulfurase
MDYRSEFADFGDTVYLDVAHQAPLPRVAARALREAVGWKELPHTMPGDVYFGLPDRVRSLLAQLLGVQAEEIALTTGASAGLAALAAGLDWKPGDEIVLAEGEFPAHFASFAPLAERWQVQLKRVRPRGRFLAGAELAEAVGPRTRLVSASLVRFHDGTRLEVEELAEACRRTGAWLVLDVSQCAGALPLDAATLGANALVAAGYKWLLGPYGTGFFWLRRDRMAEMRPAPFYWTALPGAREFGSLDLSPYRPGPDARRWDAPETASLNLVAWEASLAFLLRVGVETVWAHNRALLEALIARLPVDRCVLASPREPDRRGPYVAVAGRSPERTRQLYEQLGAANIRVSLREGALRIAPHLFTTADDIERLIRVLSI